MVAVSVGFVTVTVCGDSTANTADPVFLHRRIGSKPCELLQRGSLVTTKEFAMVEIEGENSEIYSPEMGPGDYLSPASSISARAGKDVRKSGFELKQEPTIIVDLPTVRGLTANADCPGTESAISEVEQARALRRAALQARVYQPSTDDITPASFLKQEAEKPDQKAASSKADDTRVKTAKKQEGTVFLIMLIGTDGTVKQSKIVRSVSPELDKQAVEQASRFKFVPARKKGLPVPSTMPFEVTFKLH